MRTLVLWAIVVTSLWPKVVGTTSPPGPAGRGVLLDHMKLSASATHTEDGLKSLTYSSDKENLWGEVTFSSLSGTSIAKAPSEDNIVDFNANNGGPSSGGGPGDDRGPKITVERTELPFGVALDSSSEFPTMGVQSPMESLKQVWRGLISVPPSAAQLEQILKGSMSGYDYVSELKTSPPSSAPNAAPLPKTAEETSTTLGGVNSILNTTLLSNQFPLRANGTHQESLYRQVLSQFLDPLASDGKRSLWLDQEFALKLKGSVVIAHHPELWRQIGDGLKPQLNRGIRLLTPSSAKEQGPLGVAPIHNVVVTALSHSLGANLAFLNLRRVEKVRDLALQRGVSSDFLSKANIVAALLDACEDSYVETAHPAVVVIDGPPGWLLSDEAASEVVLGELKSVSSRVMFLAVPPRDTLRIGDFSPSARPPPPAPAAQPAPSSPLEEIFGGDAPSGSSFSPFANLFDPAAEDTPAEENAANGANNKDGPVIPPWFQSPSSSPQQQMQVPQGTAAPPANVAGRLGIQMLFRSNGTLTMTPVIAVNGDQNPAEAGQPLPESFKQALEEHMKRLAQSKGVSFESFNATMAGLSSSLSSLGPQLKLPSMTVALFPPTMSPADIHSFVSNPANKRKIAQLIDNAAHAYMLFFSAQNKKLQLQFIKDNLSPPGLASDENKPPEPEKTVMALPGAFLRQIKKRPDASAQVNTSSDTSSSGPVSAHKAPKFRSATTLTHSPSSSSAAESAPETDISQNKNVLSPSGAEIVSNFPELLLEPPQDLNLRHLWDRMCDDDVSGRILRWNKRQITQELKKNKLKHAVGALRALEPILRRQVLGRDEVKLALRSALQFQAGKYSAIKTTPAVVTPPAQPTTVTGPDSTSASTETPSTPTGAAPRTGTMTTAASTQIVLSQWALDTAFCAALKVPAPRLGRPAARSVSDILALVTDKHEKSLVGNVISPQDIGVTYDMIGGLEDVKEMLRQCITYPLKYPRLYQEGVAAEAVKGVLLFGPPGTGKTMLAKAVATEGGATFLTIDASVIENKWLGESEKNAKAVFTLARRLAPCVVYLDEVDSILSSREQGDDSSHGTLTSVKTTLMQEWDGLRTTKDRVVVIASTNRPFDLDEAVLRRLPRRIMVDLPDLQTRQEILSVTLAGNRVHGSVNFTQLAEKLEGYTGSDIKEVCREAVVRVAHERARRLERGVDSFGTNAVAGAPLVAHIAEGLLDTEVENDDFNAPLRAVTLDDFRVAMRKLKASVNNDGRELQKVVEWNSKYGEFKRKPKGANNAHLSLYV